MEIRWIAQGQPVPDCCVDVRILQVLVPKDCAAMAAIELTY
jgi:hypothetical protein